MSLKASRVAFLGSSVDFSATMRHHMLTTECYPRSANIAQIWISTPMVPRKNLQRISRQSYPCHVDMVCEAMPHIGNMHPVATRPSLSSMPGRMRRSLHNSGPSNRNEPSMPSKGRVCPSAQNTRCKTWAQQQAYVTSSVCLGKSLPSSRRLVISPFFSFLPVPQVGRHLPQKNLPAAK